MAPATRKTATAASLAQMLVQALHSGDDALLEEVTTPFTPQYSAQNCAFLLNHQCLGHAGDAMVRTSLLRLPTQYVVQLLTAVIAKFEVRF